jgi:outer membrane protein assembly factor BamB
MSTLRLRKFTPDGGLLWMKHYPECKMTASPALYNGTIYLLCPFPEKRFQVKALSMDSGDEQWTKTLPGQLGPDSQSLLVTSGKVIFPMEGYKDATDAMTNSWRALNSSTGEDLWHYIADEVIWNAVPATPGDGTLLFGAACGGASRITLEGKLIWRSGAPQRLGKHQMCSTGGGSLGPNGLFYTEHTAGGGSAKVSAYQVSDGKLMWERTFEKYAGGQYPAVGRLGPEGPLAVVVAIGDNPGMPGFLSIPQEQLPYYKEVIDKYLNNRSFREELHTPKQVNAVVAMDATTGSVLWRWEEDVWDHIAAAGDEGHAASKRYIEQSPENPICLPDLQGIPLITGDGTVYASSSHGGDLTAIRDRDGNGVIDANEVSKLATGTAFLNSPSVAPGLLVAAPCWGPMYVFKD